jgi:hypothetical protein
MATFFATTVSNSPRLKDPVGARQVVARFFFDGALEVVVRDDAEDGETYLDVYGHDWPAAWKMPEGADRDEFDPDYDLDSGEGFEQFLKEIAPYLAEPLTVQAIGAEKCFFPVSACEWHIRPDSELIETCGFRHSDSDCLEQIGHAVSCAAAC